MLKNFVIGAAFLAVACSKERELKINELMFGPDREIVERFLKTGERNFYFVERDQPGLLFLKLKGCDEQSFIRFVLVKTKNSNDWTFIKYNNCGQEISFKVQSKALPFYEKNRALIKSDSLEERVAIDHTKFYSFYEFRKGKLVTYKSFCKECTDWDEDRLIKERNQNKSLYKFFAQLDLELDKLIDKQPQSEL